MNESWIKLFRKFREWGWYKDANTKAVWIELLLTANFENKEYMGISIKRGQTIIGRKELAKTLGLSEQNIRTSLDHLKSTSEITSKIYSKFSVITINNFNKYQEVTSKSTSNQPASNQQVTTPKEYKNIKKEKNNYKEEFDSFLKNFNEKAGGRNYKELKKRLELFSLRRKVFSLEQLLTATKNLFGSDFYSGNNDSHWSAEPEYLLRTDEQVDRFLNLNIKKQELIKL